MSKKHNKLCRVLNYIEHLLILVSVTGCVSISSFSSLVGVPVGITSPVVRLQVCVTTAGIETYKSIIKKKKSKHDKIIFLAKTLNSIEVLISKALIDSNISHDEFVCKKEYDNMKKEINSLKTS